MNAAAASTPLRELLDRQRAAFNKHPYASVADRRSQLMRLERALLDHQDRIAAALDRDFGGRSRMEVMFSEIFVSVHAVRHARKHVCEWMRNRPRPVDWPLQPGRAWVMPQPVGVVGVIAPWNYPVFLAVAPLAGALAAGNRVMLKLSEFTPATSEALAAMVASAFEPDQVTVVNGDAAVGREFSGLPFDHLLFTGSTEVGRHVMRAAADNLTPVTLELGGKSPAIVAPDAKLGPAAADIAYGKFLNAGQTCIAPDYVLVDARYREEFVQGLRERVESYWPDAAANPEYTSIIDDRHNSRLRALVDEARAAGAQIVTVGDASEAGPRRFAPTLVIDPPGHLRLMQEEIFGPVLPIVSYRDIEEAIRYVNDRERPLALYLFTRSDSLVERVLRHTHSGGVTVNDTLVHIAAEDLPFGGIGPSGSGHYHGREGFDTFSKLKPVFRRRWPGLGRFTRPPYGRMHKLLKRILIG